MENSKLQLCFMCIAFLSSVAIVKAQTIEDGGIMVECYSNANCGGTGSTTLTLDACCIHPDGNPVRLSYVRDDIESCLTCPLIFGFLETTYRGVERGQPHELAIGRTSGIIPGQLVITVDLRLGTGTDASDVSLAPNRFSFIGNAANQNVAISHIMDRIAQEFDETYELVIIPTNPLPIGATLLSTVTITIVDADIVTFSLIEVDYRENENSGDPMQVTVFKQSSISLANPVTLMIVPLTIQQALDHEDNILDTFEDENPFSSNRADEADFDTSVIILEFPSDILSPVIEVSAPIALRDDEINEADVQTFIIYLKVINSTNPSLIATGRIISQGRIINDDPIHIGFAQQVHTFMEPDFLQLVFGAVLLIKEDNRVSEQTFGVIITVSEPASSTRPATLESDDFTISFDYTLTTVQNSILLEFPPDRQNLSFGNSFFLNYDDLPEGTEGFQASSTSASSSFYPSFRSPVSVGSPRPRAYQTTEIQITDNDFAVVGFEQTMYTVNEADDMLEVCVVITNPPIQEDLPFPIALAYTSMAGTAGDDDFALDNTFGNIIVFPVSDGNIHAALRRSCFNVFITDDSIFENIESFSLLLELDSFVEQSGIRVQPNVTEISIEEVVVIGFINQPYNANENDGVVSVEVGIISGSLQREVSVQFSSSDSSALNTQDYVSSNEVRVFSPTMTSHTIEVSLLDDGIFELNEVFIGNLALLSSAGIPPVRIDFAMADITIIDDDFLEFGFNPNSTQVLEDSGSVSLVVSLLSGNSGEFTVQLTAATLDNTMVDNQALAGLDYVETSAQLTFLPGVVDQNFSVTLINDNITEIMEIFSGVLVIPILQLNGAEVTISGIDASRIRIAVPQANVSIVDEDVELVIIGFINQPYNANENDRVVSVEVGIISGSPQREVSVQFTSSDSSALNAQDYASSNEVRVFSPNMTSHTIEVSLLDDDIFELNEVFIGNLALSSPDDAPLVRIRPAKADITIIDDDFLEFGFNPNSTQVSENSGSVSLVVSLLSGDSGEFTVQLTAATFDNTMVDNQALAGLDYEEISTQLTFLPGVVDQNFIVTLINNNTVEIFSGALVRPILQLNGSEVTISGIDESRIRVTVPQADVSIVEDDVPSTPASCPEVTCPPTPMCTECPSSPPTTAPSACAAGEYRVTTADGDDACMVCPANSVITTADSPMCECIQGYFRHQLEDDSVSCTRPPSACRNLHVIESRTRANTITVMWERPLITGRDDFYYNIHHSNPDLQGGFLLHNINPLIRTSPLVRYSVSGLRPLTNYTIRVSVLNAVSNQDTAGEEGRRCEVTAITGDINPQAPRSVSSFCDVIVWQAPSRAYGTITGYDVMFADTVSTSNSSVVQNLVLKNRDQLFHVVRESDLPRPGGAPMIQVRAKTGFTDGIWSPLIPLNCST